VSERAREAVEEESEEEERAPPGASPGTTTGEDRRRERPSPLEMLYREAEVIAQNLKESGTRR
jgi:hypothetical protein